MIFLIKSKATQNKKYPVYRCTLMGFERSPLIIIPFNLMNISLIRYYSSKPVQHNLKMDLDPWFLTGFVDAEGNFSLGISRNKDCKTGWNIRIFF